MKKRIFGILFILLINFVSGQLADSPWPMLHHDLRHTGLSPYNTGHVDGTVRWTFDTGASMESSPTIAPDGTIYIGTDENDVYAVNPDGTLKWKFDAGEPVYSPEWNTKKGIHSAPTIGKDGTIYFIAPPIYLFALNPDGTEKWRYPIYLYAHVAASPVLSPDSTIYATSESYPHEGSEPEFGARVYAINPEGTLKWRYDTAGSCLGNPIAVADDGTFYVSGSDLEQQEFPYTHNAVFAFRPDGTIKWKYQIGRVEGPPTIAEDGTIYVGTKEGRTLFALAPDGTKKWTFKVGGEIGVMSALDKKGNIYFGSWDGNFHALSPEGQELWSFDVKKGRDPQLFGGGRETIISSAAISSDGTIYFGDVIDTFYALDLNGKEKWRYNQGGGFVSSPAIGADGTVYIASLDKKLYAFGGAKEDFLEKTERPLKEELGKDKLPEKEQIKKPEQKTETEKATKEQKNLFQKIIYFLKKWWGK
ncbi:MAG: PQQ-binding-like beta-propeller repeat protein [Nanoarchaeota archaeon]